MESLCTRVRRLEWMSAPFASLQPDCSGRILAAGFALTARLRRMRVTHEGAVAPWQSGSHQLPPVEIYEASHQPVEPVAGTLLISLRRSHCPVISRPFLATGTRKPCINEELAGVEALCEFNFSTYRMVSAAGKFSSFEPPLDNKARLLTIPKRQEKFTTPLKFGKVVVFLDGMGIEAG